MTSALKHYHNKDNNCLQRFWINIVRNSEQNTIIRLLQFRVSNFSFYVDNKKKTSNNFCQKVNFNTFQGLFYRYSLVTRIFITPIQLYSLTICGYKLKTAEIIIFCRYIYIKNKTWVIIWLSGTLSVD